jgi:hypothetical protein
MALETLIKKYRSLEPETRRKILDNGLAVAWGFTFFAPIEAYYKGAEHMLVSRSQSILAGALNIPRTMAKLRDGYLRNEGVTGSGETSPARRWFHDTAQSVILWTGYAMTAQYVTAGIVKLTNLSDRGIEPERIADIAVSGIGVMLVTDRFYYIMRDKLFSWCGEPAALEAGDKELESSAARFLTLPVSKVIPVLRKQTTVEEVHAQAPQGGYGTRFFERNYNRPTQSLIKDPFIP